MRAILLSVCIFSTSVAATGWAAEFRAGAAKADITPLKWPVHMVGSFNERLAEKAWDPLHARAIVLDDGKTTLAIVVVDSCLVDRKYFDAAKVRVTKKVGIPADKILCSATHTHTAPPAKDRLSTLGYGTTPEYIERLTSGIVNAVAAAHRNLAPAEMAHGVVAVPEEVFNRRWYMKLGGIVENPFGRTDDVVRMNPPRRSPLLDRPAGPTDPDVNFLSFRTLDGRPIGLLANYSLHYVGGIRAGGVSADYFGEFARLVEKELAADADQPAMVAMMTNGTSGDVNNINFKAVSQRREPFEKMKAVARLVSQRVLQAHKQVKFNRGVTLNMSQRLLKLKKRVPSPELVAWAKKVVAAKEGAKLPRRAKPYARRTLDLSRPPHSAELVLQAARIGSVGLTAIPCEVFCEIGLEIKAKSPLKKTFTIELANGHYGYLPTPRQHKLGGYETWLGTNVLEKSASEKIQATVLELLAEVAGEAG